MANVSIKELQKLRGRVQSLSKRAQSLRAETGKLVSRIVDAAEVTGTCFAFGVLQGRQGSIPEVLGIPVDLLCGIGMHGLAFFDIGDGMTRHLVAIGNGGLASYGHNMGVSVGAGMTGATPAVQGALPAPVEGMDLTEAEMAELAGLGYYD